MGNLSVLFIVHFIKMISLIFKNQSIYFDEPNPARPKGSSPEKLPDWVVGELEPGEHRLSESWQFSSGEDSTVVLSASGVHRYAAELNLKFGNFILLLQLADMLELLPLIIRFCFTL